MTTRNGLLGAILAVTVPLAALAQEAAKPAEPPKADAMAAPAPAPTPPPPAAKAAPKVTVTPYGFVLLNAFFNANTFAAPDYPGAAAATQAGGSFLMSARQSRFGVNLALTDDNWVGFSFAGKIEFDFKAGHLPGGVSVAITAPTAPATVPTAATGSLTTGANGWNAALMRLRVATVTATKKFGDHSVSILTGQDYGLVNPLFATSVGWAADPIFWQAGNAWRRTPQARLTYAGNFGMFGVDLAAALLSPSTGDGTLPVNTGVTSRMPDMELRLGLKGKFTKDINANVGVGLHTNNRRYNYGTPTQVDVAATMLGVDLDLNVPFANIRGEWFTSSGMDETYNGILGNSVALKGTTRTPIKTNGLWGQLVIKPFDIVWATIGYGMTGADETDLRDTAQATSTRMKNSQLAGGLILNAGKFWQAGVEVCSTTTKYFGGATGAAGSGVERSALQTMGSVKFTF